MSTEDMDPTASLRGAIASPVVQHRCLGMHRRSHAISEVSAVRVSGAGLDRRSRCWWGSDLYVRVVFKDGRRMGVGSEFAGILVQKIRSRMLR